MTLFQSRREIWTAVISGYLTVVDPAVACPAFLELDGTEGWVGQVDLRKIHLFALDQKKSWSQLPLQIVPIDAELSYDRKRIEDLQASTPTKSSRTLKQAKPVDPAITKYDRLIFETSGFNSIRADAYSLPCGATRVIELSASVQEGHAKAFGYLVECEQHTSAEIAPRRPVTADPTTRQIRSAEYLYTYHPRNELLYEDLTARTSSGEMVRTAYESDIAIRLDIKRFFTLEFNNSDVESYVTASNSGALGLVEGVSFFLRLLAFKIDLKLSTIASFFEKSANIPMVIDVPRHAPDVLHSGSGSLYSFKVDKALFDTTHPMSSMPLYRGPQSIDEAKARIKALLERCTTKQCGFRLMGKVENDTIAIDMKVPRDVVEMGFYPVFVEDVRAFRKQNGWKNDPRADGQSRAFFYETSGLSKGRYKMETWILFGRDAQSTAGCPAKVSVTPTNQTFK